MRLYCWPVALPSAPVTACRFEKPQMMAGDSVVGWLARDVSLMLGM